MPETAAPTAALRTIAFILLCILPALLLLTRAGADIALCIIGLLFLIESARNHAWGWTRHPELRTLAALWCFLMAAAPFTPINPESSFIAAAIWGRFLLFFAAARFWLLQDAGALRTLSRVGFVVLVFAAVDTLWQYLTGYSLTGRHMISERLTGALGTANIGNYLLKTGLPIIGLLAYQLVESKQFRRLWIPAAGFAAIMSLVMVSGERSTVLLLLLSIAIVGTGTFACLPKARKLVLGACGGIVLLLGMLIATQSIIQQKIHFFAEQMSDFENTPYGQLYMAASRLWLKHPITGIGPHQFLKACEPEVLNVTYCDIHPHNMYVEWLVTGGLPGILLFLAAMGFVLYSLLKEAVFSGEKTVLTAFALAQFGVLLFPFVVTQSVFSNWSAVLFWYSLALGMSILKITTPRQSA